MARRIPAGARLRLTIALLNSPNFQKNTFRSGGEVISRVVKSKSYPAYPIPSPMGLLLMLGRWQKPNIMTKRILIADDSSFLREQLRLRIERHPDWRVCEAVDGVEAVRKSRQLDPDAVVLDLGMPEMDGLAVGRRLRQLMPKLPMALFSIETSSQLQNAAQANGIAAVFSKTQWTQLFQWLETVLGSPPPSNQRKVPFAA
jgi:CheY-like chemotaxis protein